MYDYLSQNQRETLDTSWLDMPNTSFHASTTLLFSEKNV